MSHLAATMVPMPMPRKPDPERYCEACGTRLARKRYSNGKLESLLHFSRRPYCDRECMRQGFRQKPKTTSGNWSTMHRQARLLKPDGPCEECGSASNVDVHHVDHNWQNNSLENLKRLCRSCHLRAHGKVCSIQGCEGKHKGHGLCDKHYQRMKRWGDPLATKVNQHMPLRTASVD